MELFFLCGMILAFYGRVNYSYHWLKSVEICMDVITEIVLFQISFTYFIGWNIQKRTCWQELLNLLIEIDFYFHAKLIITKKSLIVFYTELILYLLVLFSFTFFDYYMMDYTDEIILQFRYIHFHFGNGYVMFISSFIVYLLKMFSRRYECLNEYLIKQSYEINHPQKIAARIKEIVEIHGKMGMFIEQFNKIFGWFIFLFIIYVTCSFVFYIYRVVFVENDLSIIFTYLVYPALMLVSA